MLLVNIATTRVTSKEKSPFRPLLILLAISALDRIFQMLLMTKLCLRVFTFYQTIVTLGRLIAGTICLFTRFGNRYTIRQVLEGLAEEPLKYIRDLAIVFFSVVSFFTIKIYEPLAGHIPFNDSDFYFLVVIIPSIVGLFQSIFRANYNLVSIIIGAFSFIILLVAKDSNYLLGYISNETFLSSTWGGLWIFLKHLGLIYRVHWTLLVLMILLIGQTIYDYQESNLQKVKETNEISKYFRSWSLVFFKFWIFLICLFSMKVPGHNNVTTTNWMMSNRIRTTIARTFYGNSSTTIGGLSRLNIILPWFLIGCIVAIQGVFQELHGLWFQDQLKEISCFSYRNVNLNIYFRDLLDLHTTLGLFFDSRSYIIILRLIGWIVYCTMAFIIAANSKILKTN